MRTHTNRMSLCGAIVVLAVAVASSAHVGDTQFIPQVPDPSKMVIDGNDTDWAWMDAGFAFTSDMLTKGGNEPDFTRADFDVAYQFAWSAPPDNSLYMFVRTTDDVLDVNEDDPNWWWSDDAYLFAVDADHSGGSTVGTEIEHINNGQRWAVRVFPAPAGGLNAEYGTTGMYHGPSIFQGLPQLAWGHLPPYGQFGSTITPAGSAHGATDVTYTYEWKMGLWDFYSLSPGESVRHILGENQTIGMETSFGDSDKIDARNDNGWDSSMTIGGNHANADEYLDYVLIATEGAVTAVEDATWGRIKSHLQARLSL